MCNTLVKEEDFQKNVYCQGSFYMFFIKKVKMASRHVLHKQLHPLSSLQGPNGYPFPVQSNW